MKMTSWWGDKRPAKQNVLYSFVTITQRGTTSSRIDRNMFRSCNSSNGPAATWPVNFVWTILALNIEYVDLSSRYWWWRVFRFGSACMSHVRPRPACRPAYRGNRFFHFSFCPYYVFVALRLLPLRNWLLFLRLVRLLRRRNDLHVYHFKLAYFTF